VTGSYVYVPPTAPLSLEPRSPALSATTLARIMTPHDTNLHGNVHGGVVLHLVDELGGAVAARHCGGRAVTASMDEFQFLVPVHVGDLVRAVSQVNWAGRTSMEVGVRVVAERWDDASAPPRHVASAYLVYVALGEDGAPRRVPPLVRTGPDEHRRFREGEVRRSARLARREEILRVRALRHEEV
jgi:acyl-CoA hydrolase